MTSVFYYILIFVAVISIGCGKLSENVKIIENTGTSNLKVKIYSLPYNGFVRDSFLVNSKSFAIIEKIVSKDGPRYYSQENCVSTKQDSISISVNSSSNLEVKKNLNNSSNWVFSKSGVDTECRATITDADIVPK